MKKFSLILAILGFMGLQVAFAQTREITGVVTSSDDGSSIPGVSVVIKGTTLGTITNMDGEFNLKAPQDAAALIFSFVGMTPKEVALTAAANYNVVMDPDVVGLNEVVVTALGITREKKTLSYAAQDVSGEQLDITGGANIKDAIAGKVAGVQMVGQAGSKLGSSGKIRIRGAISLTSDADPLYVIDGVPTTDPNSIDMGNVESINVLKGPNATALYGQRAEYGVIMITSKKAKKGAVAVEINSNTTFENVAYLPKYQNLYGGGYDGQDEWTTFDYEAGAFGSFPYPDYFEVFNGERYIFNGYADESWGPKFDGEPYIAWNNWWPDSPDYGKTSIYEAQPDNIKDFYDTGVTLKNSVSVSGSGEDYSARISYTNLDQNGLIPSSSFKKNIVSGAFDFDATDKLSVGVNFNFSTSKVEGDFDDGYSNQTTGSFNSWFSRGVDVNKMKELKDLKTPGGYSASWNWWGPDMAMWAQPRWTALTEKPAFWFNPYFWLENYKQEAENTRLIGDVHASYKFDDHFVATASVSTNYRNYSRYFELPYIVANSADPTNYNTWNDGFGNYKRTEVENNYNAMLRYNNQFGDFDVEGIVGGTYRTNTYDRFSADMDIDSKTQGLVLPDVFTYSNTKLPVTASTYKWDKEVASLYARFSVGYKDMLYVDGTYRQDWSSALPEGKNGYGYPSIGSSFIFSELINDKSIVSFGKLRAGWAQVGNDLSALLINPVYPLSSSPYMGNPQMYTNTQMVDPNIEPALNTSAEVGFDLKFLKNRFGLSFTYFNEVREKEIIPVTLSSATGSTSYLTNAGKSKRTGVEIVVDGNVMKTKDFSWDITLNYGKSTPTIEELPAGLKSMDAPGGSDDWRFVTVTHELGSKWGQLRGRAIKTDEAGNKVVNAETGTYAYETGQYLGSVLPDFTGGVINSFTLFNMVNISAAIDFQKGGNFFSLSEMWGQYSGLLEETAAFNDKGMNVRDAVADGGGVHVVGVDTDGNPYDQYVDSYDYYTQFNSNNIASEYVHDASYIKLRDVNVTFNLPKKWLNATFINSAKIGFVGRNLWMIAVADDNVHGWDPSELSKTYGENAQLPGTRSYGFNVNLTF